MLTVGGSLYAVGGSGLAGDVPSIERYDSEKGAWEEVAQVAISFNSVKTREMVDNNIIRPTERGSTFAP